MVAKVFISYRRDNSNYQTRMIHEAFSRVLPWEHIFMDVDLIAFGADFRKILRSRVDECEVLLALIGPNWLNATDPKTKGRRLDDPSDFVRIEIGEALVRGIPVVPVLIDGTPMPEVDLLPDDLKELVDQEAGFVEYRTFHADVEQLIRKLGLTPAQTEGRRQVRWGWIAAAVAAVLAIAYVGATFSIPAWWRATSVGIPDASVGRTTMAEQSQAEQVTIAESDRRQAVAEAERRAVGRTAQRDPALSVRAGSGQSFRDHLADGQPCPLCPEMLVAPAGAFTMGSPVTEDGRNRGETQTPVTIAQPFAVGKFAVTFDQWDACIADGGCNGYRPADQGWGRGNRPVINVNWADANAYAEWLSGKTGKTYRLLSDAEREYVTRARTITPFWWGFSIAPKQANYDGNYTYGVYGGDTKGEYRGRTVPVDSFEPNPWGLFNVHGNVSEWTADCWNASNQGRPGNGNARTNVGDCGQRVIRGGSWGSNPRELRAASRSQATSVDRHHDIGFRLARTLNP
jgi:formylglycine-generating enzyme required for sulfatase activity